LSRPNLQTLTPNYNPFLNQQKYPALVSIIPDGSGWKTCQRLWLFDVTVQPTGKAKDDIIVGAKSAIYKFGLPETGLRLSVPSLDLSELKPIACIAIPANMLGLLKDGFADFFTSYNGRVTTKLSDINDLLERKD
jgi:hypothetical protein